MSRHFPPPWTVQQIPGGYKVLDATGSATGSRSRQQQTGLELKELIRVGRRSLAIGIAVLVVSIVASQMVAHNLEPRTGERPSSNIT
jgi:hypothetical protein